MSLENADLARLAHKALRLVESGVDSEATLKRLAKQGMQRPPEPGEPQEVGVGRAGPVHPLANVAATTVWHMDKDAPGPTDAKQVERLMQMSVEDIYKVWDEAVEANLRENHPKDLEAAEKSRRRGEKQRADADAVAMEQGLWTPAQPWGHGREPNLANAMYDLGRQGFAEADLDWTTAVFKLYLIDSADYTVNLGTHQFVSDIAAAAREELSGAIGGKTATAGVLDGNDLTPAFAAAAGDPCEAIVIAQTSAVGGGADVAVTAQRLMGYVDTATGLPVILNGGDVNVAFDNGANRIVKI